MPGLTRDDVIAAIYAAATEPDGLAAIADALKTYLDADSAGVWLTEGAAVTGMTQTQDIADSIRPYLEYYRALDPWTASPKAPGLVYLGSDTVDEKALVRSEFYQDFARRFGMLRPMGLVFGLKAGRAATFALNRTATRKLLGEEDRVILQDIAVHLQGALTLRARFMGERGTTLARGAALDGVSFGIVVCSRDAKILDMNQAALDLVAAGAGIQYAPGPTIAAGSAAETQALHRLIGETVALGRPGAMRVGSGQASLSIQAVPARLQPEGWPAGGTCILYVERGDAPSGPGEAALIEIFGLSRAQAGLCVLLYSGLTFEEAAARRGIATSTARTHFGVILRRTGAKNLRDLLRLLATLPTLRG